MSTSALALFGGHSSRQWENLSPQLTCTPVSFRAFFFCLPSSRFRNPSLDFPYDDCVVAWIDGVTLDPMSDACLDAASAVRRRLTAVQQSARICNKSQSQSPRASFAC